MPRQHAPRNEFAKALKTIRRARRLSQEDFGFVSSRTYVSSLERGNYSPTLNKVDELAKVLEVHPLVLLTLAYSKVTTIDDIQKTLLGLETQFKEIL
jgi:transcriptional regulator with XRE-family HTH domain